MDTSTSTPDSPARTAIPYILSGTLLIIAAIVSTWFVISHHTDYSTPTALTWDILVIAILTVPAATCLVSAIFAPNPTFPDQLIIESTALAGDVILIVWAIMVLGVIQFNGWDYGNISEMAYRQYLGDVPDVSFPCRLPYEYVLGLKYAFVWFGVRWTSLVIAAALFSAVTLCWHYILLRRIGMPWIKAMFLASVLQVMISIPNSCLWYNPTASLAAISLFLSAIYALRFPARWGPWISFAIAAMWVMMAKSNGYPLLPFCLLATMVHGWKTFAKALGATIAGVAGWLTVAGISGIQIAPIILGLFDASKSRAGFFSSPFFNDASVVEVRLMFLLEAVAGVIALAMLLIAVRRFKSVTGEAKRLLIAEAICLVGAVLVGALFIQTNAQLKTSDFAVVLCPLSLFLLGPALGCDPAPNSHQRYAWYLVLALTICLVFSFIQAISWGVVRRAVELGGPGRFYEPQNVRVREGLPPFFDSVAMGDGMESVVLHAARFQALIPRDKTIFIGPRISFLYPALHIRPPQGLPVNWLEGGAYSKAEGPALVNRFTQCAFDYLVFLNNNNNLDATFMGQPLINYITTHYKAVMVTPAIIVLQKQ